MDTCNNCGATISSNQKYCNKCGCALTHGQLNVETSLDSKKDTTDEFSFIKNKIEHKSLIQKIVDKTISIKCFVLACLVLFIIGFCFGSCGKVDKKVSSSLITERDALLTEKDELTQNMMVVKKEYDDYKAKMQPYEGIEIQDAENRKEAERIRIEQENQALKEKKEAEAAAEAQRQAQAEEERKKAEAEAAAEAAKGYETGITYDNLARTPDDYNGKKVKFKGKVVQVLEGTLETQIRLAVNKDYNKILYCRVPKAKTTSTRILEDDIITIFGVSEGLITYKSTMGGEITIPQVSVDDWGPN